MDVDEEMTAEGKIISFEGLGEKVIKLDPLILFKLYCFKLYITNRTYTTLLKSTLRVKNEVRYSL